MNFLNYKIGSCDTALTVTHQEVHVKTEGKVQFFWNVRLFGEKQCYFRLSGKSQIAQGGSEVILDCGSLSMWKILFQKEVWEGCEGNLCTEEPQSIELLLSL